MSMTISSNTLKLYVFQFKSLIFSHPLSSKNPFRMLHEIYHPNRYLFSAFIIFYLFSGPSNAIPSRICLAKKLVSFRLSLEKLWGKQLNLSSILPHCHLRKWEENIKYKKPFNLYFHLVFLNFVFENISNFIFKLNFPHFLFYVYVVLVRIEWHHRIWIE